MIKKVFFILILFLASFIEVNAIELDEDLIIYEDTIFNDQLVIPEGKSITMDLNDKTLEASSNGVRKIINRGQLVVKNGTIENKNSGAYGIIDNYGTINVQNVIFNDAGCGDGSTLKNRSGTITVKDSVFNITCVKNGNAGIYSDGNITINDTIFSSSSSGAYPLVINSGNAIINNASVTGSKGGMAINGGSVTINGGTYTGNTYYGIWITNDGETDVTIKDGKFYGKKYGLYAAVDDGLQDLGDVGIKIMGGYFEGETKSAALVNDDKSDKSWGMDITGGTFTTTVTKYVKTNYREYMGEDVFIVAPQLTAQIAEGKYLEYGTTSNLNIIYIDYLGESVDVNNLPITINIEDESIAKINNDGISALKNGMTNIIVDMHDGRDVQKLELIVYSIEDKTPINNSIKTSNLDVNLNALVESILTQESDVGVDLETIEKIKTNILEGNSIDAVVNINDSNNTIINANQNTINSIMPKGYNLLNVYDIEIKLYANQIYIGNINKTNTDINVKLTIDNQLNIKSNYKRIYKVVRIHDNDVQLLDADIIDNELSFSSDKFSLYAVIYKDELKSILDDVPKTGDFTLYLIIIAMSIIFVVGTFWYYKAPKYETK